MTVDEYAASTPLRRLRYRLFRNPLIMFGLGPFFSFVIVQRLPPRGASRKQILSVILVSAAIAGIVIAASLTIGIKACLLIPVISRENLAVESPTWHNPHLAERQPRNRRRKAG